MISQRGCQPNINFFLKEFLFQWEGVHVSLASPRSATVSATWGSHQVISLILHQILFYPTGVHTPCCIHTFQTVQWWIQRDAPTPEGGGTTRLCSVFLHKNPKLSCTKACTFTQNPTQNSTYFPHTNPQTNTLHIPHKNPTHFLHKIQYFPHTKPYTNTLHKIPHIFPTQNPTHFPHTKPQTNTPHISYKNSKQSAPYKTSHILPA